MRASSSRATSRKLWLTSAVGAFAALALAGTAWSGNSKNNGNGGVPPSEIVNDETFSQANAVAIPGAPLVSFDISWVDPVLRSYFLADRSNSAVDVVNTANSTVKQFKPGFVGFTGNNNTSGPDGVLTAENSTQLWVGDGMSRVWVLNPTLGTPLTPPSGGSNPIYTTPPATPPALSNANRADELCFDPVDHLVMAANNADNPPFASIISTKSFKVVGKVVFDGTNGAPNATNGAEQCAWSPRTGMFTITIPGINTPDDGTGVVAVIDPKKKTALGLGKVVKTFGPYSLNDCSIPQGQAVGPAPQILIGCNGPSPNGPYNTIIINENNGTVIQTLLGEGGNDEVWFGEDNNGTPTSNDGHYFLARGQASVQYLGIVDSQFRAQDQSIQTGTPGGTTRRAHSVAADYTSGLVYMPIPATGGGSPGFQSAVCSFGLTGALAVAAEAAGCIAIFAPTLPDDLAPKVVERKQKGDNHHDWDDHHAWDDHHHDHDD
jgi:hypothetical protein